MKLLVDARKLGHGGIGVYIENLLSGLAQFFPNIQVSALVAPAYAKRLNVRTIVDAAEQYSLSEMWGVGRRQGAEIAAHDLFHEPHYTLPFYSLPRGLKRPAVTTIHDIIHVTHPDTFFHRPIAKVLIRSAVRRSAQIVTVSKASARLLGEYFPETQSKLTVVPNALRAEMQRLEGPSLATALGVWQLVPGYTLFVADHRPHKNFDELFRAWSLKKRRPLVVIGKGYEAFDDQFRVLQQLGAKDLAVLYSGAAEVVVPSLVEGFGLVPLEALACGARVISRELPSVREICGEHATFYRTEAELASLLEGEAPSGHDIIQQRIEQAQRFSLREATFKTVNVYERALACA